jgi:hypothetical protein
MFSSLFSSLALVMGGVGMEYGVFWLDRLVDRSGHEIEIYSIGIFGDCLVNQFSVRTTSAVECVLEEKARFETHRVGIIFFFFRITYNLV